MKSGAETILQVYPNPAQGQRYLSISGEINGNMKLSLINSTGQIIWVRELGLLNSTSMTYPLQIGHLSAGLYILRIDIGENTYYLREVEH
jgi:hypothetical protein